MSSRKSEYDHLHPMLQRYADPSTSDRERTALRSRLIVGFEPLARHLARRHAGRHADVELDLVQVGIVGLIKAVDRYDPARVDGDPLGYLIPCIRGEMLRYFRDKSWAMRVPRRLKDRSVSINKATGPLTARLGRAPRPSELAAELGVGVEDVLEALEAQLDHHSSSLDADSAREDGRSIADTVGNLDGALETLVDSASVRPLIEALPAREREILRLRFFEDMTQSQIAESLGISQMHVSRLLARTLSDLRAGLG